MELRQLTALELGAAIKRGMVSIPEAAQAALDAIQARDGTFNSFITVTGERAMERARALQKDYEDAMAGARTDVIKAMLDMDAARELITTTRYGVDSARENYAMSQKRYMTNIGTITDLVDAQVRLTEAERDASRALADYHSARARFYFNIGQENPGLR